MKYLVMIYSNPKSWVHPVYLHQEESLTDAERTRREEAFAALMEEIAETGEAVTSHALASPETARTVRTLAGNVQVTDGPFIEAKEQLAGYFVLECAGMDRAVELAARFPDVADGAVEVRPIMHPAGLEM